MKDHETETMKTLASRKRCDLKTRKRCDFYSAAPKIASDFSAISAAKPALQYFAKGKRCDFSAIAIFGNAKMKTSTVKF